MDSSDPEPAFRPDDRIAALINEYFDRRQAGEEITVESFAAEHPDLAEELRPYLEGLSILGGLSARGPAPVDVPDTATGEFALPTIGGYVLHEEIGRGGMGVVYKALQVSTKRIVALKVVLAGAFASPAVRRRFKREVELAARLQHPGIVRVLESGRIERQRYYAMDYVEGAPLDRHLAAARPDRKAIVRLFTQICDAVEYAHGHGVIHRDLKPANILVDDEGAPHILDFGLAKPIEEAGREATFATGVSTPGQIMGTLPYLSPEQAAEEPGEIDARADVYALGVMLYQALTGTLPYDVTGRLSEIIRRIVEDPPKPPSAPAGRRDAELDAIVLKALEKEKDRRYQSARELGADLRRYLEGEPILARRPSSLYVLRKKLRKHRLAAVVCVLVVVAAISVLTGLWAESWSRQRQLANARARAVLHQHAVETAKGGYERPIGSALALFAQYPELPEVRLLYVQANYMAEETRDVATSFLEKEVHGNPSEWSLRLLLAEILEAAGDVERAAVLRAEAERIAPDTAEAWHLRSFATLDLHQALRCAEEAVARQPSHLPAWQRLTWLRVDKGDLEGALQGVDRVIELGADRVTWIKLKGKILVGSGRYQEAVEQYTLVDGYLERAHAYRRMKDYDKAVADYTRHIEDVGPGATWERYQRATPLWILGRREEALEDYRQVRVLYGRPFYSDVRRFFILHEMGRPQEAQEVLDAALRDVEEPWLGQIFGCLAGSIAPEALVADAEQRGHPEQICEAYYYAGEVCLLQDRRGEARTFFQRCAQTGLDFDPDATFLTPMNEFELAQWRLESLFAGRDEEN